MTVLDVVGIDENGDLRLEHPDRPELAAILPAETVEGPAPGVGDRVLARLHPADDGLLEARVIRMLPRRPTTIVGVVEAAGDGWRLRPADRRVKDEFILPADALAGADRGDLVLADIVPSRRLGLASAKVKQRLGRPDDPSSLSLMTAVAAGLPLAFPDDALAQAAKAKPVRLGKREDLRELDLVTIDGEDARDFDDAVWAAPDPDPANKGGHRLVVAIADVAHYVRPGDALDQEARKRGNSVYFPDRVIPMLPEALSNDLCSLRPREDRACLACEMTIDAKGQLKVWRFTRALMRSRARLTYTRVQAAFDGNPDEETEALLDPVIRPLYAAYERLLEARHKRGTIELELPERKIVFDEAGKPTGCRGPPAARQPHADRGVHDRGQRGGRQHARRRQGGLPLPRPRQARPREARGAGRLPRAPGRPLEPHGQEARRLHAPAARPGRGGHARDRLDAGPPLAGAGGLQPGEHRPLRPQPEALRPLHLADPPLQRPRGPPSADQPPGPGRGRPAEGRGPAAARLARRAPLADRAPRHGGRARAPTSG